MENEQVAFILQMIILALVLYLLITHTNESPEDMSHLPLEESLAVQKLNDMDFSRR